MFRPTRVIALVIFALVFLAGPAMVRFYTDWLWFGEVGYPQIFSTMLRGQSLLFTIAFLAAFAWMAVNLRVALASIGDVRPVFTTREGLEIALPGRRQLRTIAMAVAAVLGVLVGLLTSGRWELWLAWRNAVPFGVADPILGYDVGSTCSRSPSSSCSRASARR